MSWRSNKCCPQSLKDIEVTCCCDSSSIFLHLSLAVERQTLLLVLLCSLSSHGRRIIVCQVSTFDSWLEIVHTWSSCSPKKYTQHRKKHPNTQSAVLPEKLKQLQSWELEMSGVSVTIKAATSLLAHYNSKPELFVITGIIAMVRGPIWGKGLILLNTVWACYKWPNEPHETWRRQRKNIILLV